jgi:Trk K+ transport system NAD-binding subunit
MLPENHIQAIVISRDGKVITTEPALLLKAGDEIFIHASMEDMKVLRSRLDSRQEV